MVRALEPPVRLCRGVNARPDLTSNAARSARTRRQRFTLLPTVNFLVDPILQRLAPETVFFVAPGKPSSIVRFAGPRNYQGQMIRIE